MNRFDRTDPTRDLEPLIGNTPLLAIRFRFRGTERRIFAKSENLNMTGSVKDRMALQIMRRGYRSGDSPSLDSGSVDDVEGVGTP